jgi:HKD family nuclease
MTHTRVLDNLSGRVGDEILKCMASATRTMMAVAFVKFSGVRLIEESLVGLLDRGGKAEIIFGLDFSLTEPRALNRILEIQASHSALTLFAFSDPYLPGREPAFHPKLYMFEQADSDWTAIIGSSNLSQGGLIDNVEIGVALGGPRTDPLIADVFAFYRSVRGRESLFVPTGDYLEVYQKLRSRIDRVRRKGVKRREVKEAIDQLRKLEERLPGTVPTQKELVIQAIKSLRTSPDSWVHWTEMAEYVERRAREVGAEYKWDTLHNSVRGRLNEHTVGKGGEDLFLRKGGVQGRFGLYRLSDAGETYEVRKIVK